ncbi:MAG: tRNA lysidine(34) synthetase TilS [Candidatus Cloacimonadota bacterium]|nr:MAG: tRNA lysidine(34) synthetase TilS [Candidatus Cloacimonadota bacterium]
MKVEEIEKKVLNYIEKNGLIEEGEKILVAVSGGPDSIFLLYLLNLYKSELKIELVCCHINHNLREEASEKDERFVKDFSQKMDIPLIAKSVNVSSYKKDKHLSLEDAARRLRLKTLEKSADERDAQKIALGHTADDSIETFFLNLLRGAGRRGLLGIQPMRGRFIHPLLCLSKREILFYLKEKNIDYRIDVTNWNRQYRRNFIRRELVPLIEERLNRGVKTNISQLIEVLRDEEEILSREVKKVVKKIFMETEENLLIEREAFRRLKPGIQRRVIMRCFEGMTKSDARLNFKEIESLRTAISGTSSGLRFSYYGTTFFVGSDAVLVQNKNISSEKSKNEKVFLDIPGKVLFQNRYYITASVLRSLNGNIDDPDCAYFDLEAIHPPLVLRTRENGDKFKPFGMNQEKKVKNFLIDEKIPFWERDEIPLISDANGILWIVGLRRAEVARVREKTKRILKLEKREIG